MRGLMPEQKPTEKDILYSFLKEALETIEQLREEDPGLEAEELLSKLLNDSRLRSLEYKTRTADRVQSEFEATNIRGFVADLVKIIENSGAASSKIDLGVGNPYHPILTSDDELTQLFKLITDNRTLINYSPSTGLPLTQKAFEKFLNQYAGLNVEEGFEKSHPENFDQIFPDGFDISKAMVITNGGSEAGSLFFQIVGNRREVVFVAPSYPLHLTEPLKAGGRYTQIETTPDNNYLPTEAQIVEKFSEQRKGGVFEKLWDKFKDKIRPYKRDLVISFPTNPTGGSLSDEDQVKFAQDLNKAYKKLIDENGKGFHLTVDIAYMGLSDFNLKTFFDNLYPEVLKKTSVVFSYSKIGASPAARIGGFVTFDENLLDKMAKYKGPASNDTSIIGQYIATLGLEKLCKYPEMQKMISEEYLFKLDMMKDSLLEMHQHLGTGVGEESFSKKMGGLFGYVPLPNIGYNIPEEIKDCFPEAAKEKYKNTSDARAATFVIAAAKKLGASFKYNAPNGEKKSEGIESSITLPSDIFYGPDNKMARIAANGPSKDLAKSLASIYYVSLYQKAITDDKDRIDEQDLEKLGEWYSKIQQQISDRNTEFKKKMNKIQDPVVKEYAGRMFEYMTKDKFVAKQLTGDDIANCIGAGSERLKPSKDIVAYTVARELLDAAEVPKIFSPKVR
jgi:aspartate/methionine/tyrosine aminotransferase